jgi:CubicO group peptidase (beta-lactamase class C family)
MSGRRILGTYLVGIATLFCATAVMAQTVMAQTKPDFAKLKVLPERIARVDQVLASQLPKNLWPGSVTLIARNGQIVHFSAHGFLDGKRDRVMPKDAIFRIFSMTKPIVSVATMMLVEQGTLKPDDPIQAYLPELKDLKVFSGAGGDPVAPRRPITIQDLLRHSSGFTYSFAGLRSKEVADAYAKEDVETFTQDLAPEEVLRRLSGIPLAFQPGSTFEYGISTDILGILLERVTKKSLDVLVDEMILAPLKMRDTGFTVPEAKRNRLADAFDNDVMKARLWNWARVEKNPAARMRLGGAGMVSTTEDYFKFAQMLINGGELGGVRLLSAKTVEFMLADHIIGMDGTPAAISGPGYRFGLGFAVRTQLGMAVTPGSVGDANWSGIGGTAFTIDPKEKIVGVIMVQAPSNRIHARNLFKNLIYSTMN